ncbi:galK protein [Agrilactobacillus composti DSM 18527 = JCM 14202]|uniref:Galactokinase n=1 Tax=Agrilactobacillus composti DSM 18527 = JCM 14202 TaxID=1423734 RepID=X0PS73_9LACO|nr:galactokinase [Agrilactobacillus composti]KRM33411.1 galK protein [Agrilactobacillus composti DSM 18527 = JCM 14202]GAF40742.1 galactokinase [Agrilactobacillus composti DSM 18527 = JCM 14202]
MSDTQAITVESLKADFKTQFNTNSVGTYFAPGRINLIGEHTDYNGGRVFPCAISLGTYAAVAPRTDQTVRLYSANFPKLGIIEFDLTNLSYDKKDNWANYPKGVFHFFKEHGYQLDHGFDIFVNGNLPNGSGLSSSASIEMLFGKILTDQFNLTIDQVDVVKIGMEVENKFIGVNSGIMDQFAVGMGQKDHAILLDTNTLKYELVPIKLQDYKIIIMNTNKRRELADSKYNERRSECEEALKRINTVFKVDSLGALNKDTFDEYTYAINDDTLIRRARHAVFENQRTGLATDALKAGDLNTFGKLVNASHVSLEYDYEVTGKELDTLAHSAWQNGALGARMTGAGFGGCAIAIVKEDHIQDFIANVGQAYKAAIGYDADFYIAEIADGPKKLA